MAKANVIGVDAGNSAIKATVFETEKIGEVLTFDDFVDVFRYFPESVFFISSVRKIPSLPASAYVLTHKTPIPIQIEYSTPKTLGVDRIAGVVGAWSTFSGSDILVIDGGTCITYDLVTADGIYRGGIISPGMETRYRAMYEFTESLPKFEPDFQEHGLLGKSTESCMRIGAEDGLRIEIEGFLRIFNRKYPELRVVTTGGLLPYFDSIPKKHIFANSKIVLIGLHAIWKFNEGI